MNKQIKRLAIVGGHFAPAYVCTQSALKQNFEVVFFGRKSVFSEKKDTSLEYRTIAALPQVKWYSIDSARSTTKTIWGIIKGIWTIATSIIWAWLVLQKTRPSRVLAFGSYVSIPVCVAAYLSGIPVVIHEQTIIPGAANRLLAKIATKILITFPESSTYFPSKKVIRVGIPVSQEDQKAAPSWYTPSKRPLLLFIGGSSGSHTLNLTVESILDTVTKDFRVIHQVGDSMYNDFQRLRLRASEQYMPLEFLSPHEFRFLLNQCSVIVTRVGANTFFSLIQAQKPAILVPLPWAAYDEQRELAKIIEQAGAGIIVEQDATPETYINAILTAQKHRLDYTKHHDALESYAKLIVSGDEIIRETVC